MADTELRELDRKAAQGDVEAQARAARARISLGLCPFCHERVAVTVGRCMACWDGLSSLARARLGVEIAEACLVVVKARRTTVFFSRDAWWAHVTQIHDAIQAVRAWIECPCDEHARAAEVWIEPDLIWLRELVFVVHLDPPRADFTELLRSAVERLGADLVQEIVDRPGC